MLNIFNKLFNKTNVQNITSDNKFHISIPEMKNNKTDDDKSPVYYIVKKSTVIGNLFNPNIPLIKIKKNTIVKSYDVIHRMSTTYLEIYVNDQVFHCSIDFLQNITYIKIFNEDPDTSLESYIREQELYYYHCYENGTMYEEYKKRFIQDMKKTIINIINSYNYLIKIGNKTHNFEDFDITKDSLTLYLPRKKTFYYVNKARVITKDGKYLKFTGYFEIIEIIDYDNTKVKKILTENGLELYLPNETIIEKTKKDYSNLRSEQLINNKKILNDIPLTTDIMAIKFLNNLKIQVKDHYIINFEKINSDIILTVKPI